MKKQLKSPLRVGLLFTSVEYGGLETVVKGLIDHLDNEAFDIMPLIFTANRQKDRTLVSELQKSGKKYCNIVVDGERIKYMNPIKNLRQVHNLFRNHQFDLIHTHGYRADVIGYMAARTLNVPIIATCHGFIPNDAKLMLYNSMDRFVLKHFNRIIAVSSGIRNDLLTSGVKEENISVVPNAVNMNHDDHIVRDLRHAKRELMGWNAKHFVIGYVGRLSEEKGLGYLIDAVSDLIKLNVPVKLAVIGEGDQEEKLRHMSEQKCIDNSVSFLGFQKEVHSWLPAFDSFILPSLMEGTPMAMLEAMLIGLPVVASSVGGIPDVIKSGENGILVQSGKPEEIADAINRLYEDQEFRYKIGMRARQTVQMRYNIREWIKNIEFEYRKVVAG